MALPVRITFENPFHIDLAILCADTIVDLSFIIDSAFNFFIPLITHEGIFNRLNQILLGEFIFDKKKVAYDYLSFVFIIDTFCNVPWALMKYLYIDIGGY
jgi:hypothetical protein